MLAKVSIIQRPYEGPPDNYAEYPALTELLLFNEPSGSNIVSASKGDIVIALASNGKVTNNGDGTLSLSASANILSAGTWTAPNGKKLVAIGSCRPTSNNGRFEAGSTGGPPGNGTYAQHINTANGQSHKIHNDGTSYSVTNSRANTVNEPVSYMLVADYGSVTGLNAYCIDDTINTTVTGMATNPVSLSGIPSPSAFSAAATIAVATRPAMWSIWQFTTLPSLETLKAALELQHIYALHQFNGAYPKRLPYVFKGLT